MGLEDFILRLRVEKDNKLFKKKVNSFSMAPKTNIVK